MKSLCEERGMEIKPLKPQKNGSKSETKQDPWEGMPSQVPRAVCLSLTEWQCPGQVARRPAEFHLHKCACRLSPSWPSGNQRSSAERDHWISWLQINSHSNLHSHLLRFGLWEPSRGTDLLSGAFSKIRFLSLPGRVSGPGSWRSSDFPSASWLLCLPAWLNGKLS